MYRVCPCGVLAPHRGVCSSCNRDSRPNAGTRGYGSAWRKGPRRRQLLTQPWCEWVEDGRVCGKRATDVDHIVRRREGGSDRPSNLQSLCHSHHSTKTAGEVNAERAARPSRTATLPRSGVKRG